MDAAVRRYDQRETRIRPQRPASAPPRTLPAAPPGTAGTGRPCRRPCCRPCARRRTARRTRPGRRRRRNGTRRPGRAVRTTRCRPWPPRTARPCRTAGAAAHAARAGTARRRHGRQQKQRRQPETPDGDHGGDGERRQGEAEVATEREPAHRGVTAAGDGPGQPRGLGVVRRDSHAGQRDGRERDGVGVAHPAQRDAQAREQCADREQPGDGPAVGQHAEERLGQRGQHRGREDDARDGRVAVGALGDEEGHEGGDGPLVDVDAGVSDGQQGDREVFRTSSACGARRVSRFR